MDARVIQSAGRYARGAVLYAFERIGGADGLADWAENNQSDFYTKLFTKVVTREVEVSDNRTVDELMDALDGDYEVVQDDADSGHLPPAHPGGFFSSPDPIDPACDDAPDDLVDFPDE